MAAKLNKLRSRKGQAAIELAMSLPFLIWLIFYTLNGFYAIHTAHVGQKYAAMALYQATGNRANIVVDDHNNTLHGRDFMAVQYQSVDGDLPVRKIVSGPSKINSIIGICREPDC